MRSLPSLIFFFGRRPTLVCPVSAPVWCSPRSRDFSPPLLTAFSCRLCWSERNGRFCENLLRLLYPSLGSCNLPPSRFFDRWHMTCKLATTQITCPPFLNGLHFPSTPPPSTSGWYRVPGLRIHGAKFPSSSFSSNPKPRSRRKLHAVFFFGPCRLGSPGPCPSPSHPPARFDLSTPAFVSWVSTPLSR